MGCCCGTNIEKKIPPDWLAQFQALRLSRSELTKFFNTYKRIDRDKKGSIELQELLNFLDIENTSFTNRAFSIFDANASGKIDFREFILSLWNYCTLTKATLDIFTFDLYDEDSSGELGHKEVVQMVEDLYGKKFKANANARQVIQDLKKLEADGPFNLQRFSEFAKSHQQLLYPAFQVQMKMQDKIMGPGFWEKCTNRRVEWSKGKFISMAQMMEMHLKPELYERLAASSSFSSSRWGKKKSVVSGPAAPSLAFANTGTRHERSAAHSRDHHAPPSSSVLPNKNKRKVVIHSVDNDAHENYDEDHDDRNSHVDYYDHHHHGQTNYHDTGDDIPQEQYYDNDFVDNQYNQQANDDYHRTAPGRRSSGAGRTGKKNKVVIVSEDYED